MKMKTLHRTIAVFLMTACVVCAKQDPARTPNIVGFNKYTLPPNGGHLLLGVNWSAMGEEPRLKDLIKVEQLRAAPAPDQADKILLWNAKKGNYEAYAVCSEDNQFYAVERWMQAPANPSMPLGSGFWIESAPGSTEPSIIVLAGMALEGPPVKLNPKSKQQIIANTSPVSSPVENLVAPYKPRAGDQVAFFNGHGYDAYKLDDNGSWKHLQTGKAPPPVKEGDAIWLLPAEQSAKKQ